MRSATLVLLLLATPALAEDFDVEKTPLVRALRDELARSATLKLPGATAPYHIAYQVIDFERLRVAASFGAIVDRDRQEERYLRAEVRVGDLKLDSSNFFGEMGFDPPELLQKEDDYDALRHEIWHVTDRVYKGAVERLEKKRAAEKGQAPDPDRVGDFTAAERERLVSGFWPPLPDRAKLEPLVSKASAVFRQLPELHSGKATVSAVRMRRVLVNTEGTLVVEPKQFIRLTMTCHTQADDGMRLDHQYVTTVPTIDELPGPDALAAEAKRMGEELVALRKTAPADVYTGPVLFEARAAAQLLRALLVDELSGTPPPRGASGRMSAFLPQGTQLGERVGQRVLPVDFRVVDDPTWKGVGGYGVDDEGVRAQKVVLIDKGMLKGFLMSRAPRKGFEKSNGHGRAGVQGEARGTPSNLVVTAAKGLPDKELKKRLLARAKAEGLTYAVVIRLLDEPGVSEGGARVILFGDDDEPRLPRPLVAYKVSLDGKEEPLRGLALGSLPLRALKHIVHAGKDPAVIAWFGSGSRFGGFSNEPTVPISLSSPALLLEEIELVKAKAPQQKPPTLPRP